MLCELKCVLIFGILFQIGYILLISLTQTDIALFTGRIKGSTHPGSLVHYNGLNTLQDPVVSKHSQHTTRVHKDLEAAHLSGCILRYDGPPHVDVARPAAGGAVQHSGRAATLPAEEVEESGGGAA